MVGSLAILVGCMPGPQRETLVDDLVVLAAVPSSPEVDAGESFGVDVHLGRPNAAAVDLLVWSCFPARDEACLEEGSENRFVVVEDAQEVSSVERTVPLELAFPLNAGEELPLFVWSMACETGLCPLIEDAKAGQVDESTLLNPIDELQELPFDGVSLAAQRIWLSARSPEERRKNPEVAASFEVPELVSAGESVMLDFQVEDHMEVVEAYGYSLSGGFGEVSARVFEGEVALEWFAPEELEGSEPTRVWVVFQSEEGGSAVWSETWTVAATSN